MPDEQPAEHKASQLPGWTIHPLGSAVLPTEPQPHHRARSGERHQVRRPRGVTLVVPYCCAPAQNGSSTTTSARATEHTSTGGVGRSPGGWRDDGPAGPLTCLVTARDRVEVSPPVRVEGRLVDRGIEVRALGRGARVQFAETAQSPWTDSARAPVGGEMDRVTSDFASTGSCCWCMPEHRMCCRWYGHDHRPAMITKAHKPVIVAHRLGTFLGIQGTPERAGSSPPWPADPRSFAVDHPSFFSACSCSVGWSGVHDRSQRVSQRRLTGRLPIRADPETIHRSVVQPLAQLVATGRRSQDQQRQDRHVRLHEFDQGIATASRSAPRPVAGIGGNGTAPGSAARTHPPATPLQPGPTSAAQSWPAPPSPCSANIRPHGAGIDTCDRQCPGRCLRDGRTAGFHRSARFLPTVVLSDSMGNGRVNELSTDGC